jgi:hopanoid biosynthesis associated RND transporter like protein HpnN
MRSPVPALVGASAARPWRTVLVCLLLAVLGAGYAATHFTMSTDTGALISPDVGWRQQERRADRAFPQFSQVMLVVVDGATPELAESAAARLATKMSSDPANFRAVRRPDGGGFLAREGLLFGSRAEVKGAADALIRAQPLLGPLAADPSLRGVTMALGTMLDGVDRGDATLAQAAPAMNAMAKAIDARLAGRPSAFSWQRLFASGGQAPPTRKLILANPVLDYTSITPGDRAAEAVRSAAASLGDGVTVRITGDVALADEEFATLQENIGAVAAVMLAAMLLTLWLGTRSAKLVGAIFATIVAGLVVTTALGLLAVGRLNLISVAFIPLFVGLGVDFGIQLCVRLQAERAGGAAIPDALRRAAAALATPLTLAAVAIVLAFGAFLPTDYVGVAELGVIAALGMVVALALSVTLLPALVVLLGPGAPRAEVGLPQLAHAERWLGRHRRAVLVAFGVSMALSIGSLAWVRFDFNPLHLRDPQAPAMRALADLTRDPTRTPNTITVLVPDAASARATAAKLSRLPEVAQVVTLDSFVPADQPAKLAILSDAALLLDTTLNPFDTAPPPSDTETVAALTTTAARLRAAALSYPGAGAREAAALGEAFARLARATPATRAQVSAMLTEPLGVMLDQARTALTAEPVTRETLPADLVRDWRSPAGRYRIEVFPSGDANDNRVLERFRRAVTAVAPAASGLPVATQAAAGTIGRAFVQAGAIALVLVSLLLWAVLRSVREVAFTLAPVVLSIFLTLGTCVMIGQPINFANIIAFPLLVGVGVAFHIYFVMAWRAGATGLLTSSLARAVLFSALATGTAFGALWLSDHPGTASMGKILMISLAWTLVCALVFEPALLGPARAEEQA